MDQGMQVGIVHAAPLRVVLEEERKASEQVQNQPMIGSLAAHIRKCWSDARMAKMNTVEPRMIQNMRARRGEYDPERLGAIRAAGGSEIYSGLTSVKCRAAGSWLRDVMMTTGSDRPWVIKPMDVPDLPPDVNDQLVQLVAKALAPMIMQGQPPPDETVQQALEAAHDQAKASIQQEARDRCDRMADKMETQLMEGGFDDALDQMIDDITTFPSAILKGPVIRNKMDMKWVPDPANQGKFIPQMVPTLKMEWERVSPFNIYPSPASVHVNDGYLIEKHQLSREDLGQMIGVDGYDAPSIHVVLDQYATGGLHEWLTNDVSIAQAEGKSAVHIAANTDGLIDALQFWGSVPGKTLIEWGMDDKDVKDPTKEYHIEAWLIGHWIIKATLNYDPLARKPYYKASYEEVPGSWWGNSVADLLRDSQIIINAAARAIVNNMGIASGPQVVINVDRLAPGEDITQMTPWRIWQVTNDPSGTGQKPIDFFQPDSRIQELMAVFQMFNNLADDYSGIPKYMAGDSAGGAGRTASGMSMLMGNAGKAIKQVIGNIDTGVMSPLLKRLYDYNMQFADDPDLKGDVHIIAKGADAVMAKEAAQVRRNEFLMATANPIDMQIVGVEGRAAILRETAKNLDMDVDRVVPPLDVLRQKLAQMAMAQQAGPPGGQKPQAPQQNTNVGSGQGLANGAPTTDNFQPTPQQ